MPLPNPIPASNAVATLTDARQALAAWEKKFSSQVASAALPHAQELARASIEAAGVEIKELQGKLAEANATIARLELAATETGHAQALDLLTKERDHEKAAHKRTSDLLNLAEGALGVRGITSAQAVPAMTETGPKMSTADFERRVAQARTPEEQQAITKEFERAFAEGRIK